MTRISSGPSVVILPRYSDKTIAMWPSVRRGEEKYIFPFQEDADAMFNSAMTYELAVIKQYAEPLLFNIRKGEPIILSWKYAHFH